MRILLINHFPLQGSGSGIYTLNIALELVEKGHQVFVIDIDNQIEHKKYGFARRTILCDETKNDNADIPFNFPCFTTHPRSNNTYYKLSSEQIDKYISVFTQITNRIVKDFKPNIIHAQHIWITPYVAAKTNIPYVITAHGTDLMGFKKDDRYHKYALTGARKAKKIITISQQVHEESLKLLKIKENKLELIPNGFDENIFNIKDIEKSELKAEFDIDQNIEYVVSFVGKFTNFKGIDLLIKAAAIVNKTIPDVVFALAGHGELMTEMKELQKRLGLDNILFLGQITQKEVAKLYNLADISVVPSRVEPFGLVAIEALACGTPVVASNAGGLPDFINDKVGKLVEMDNVEALAQGMIDELQTNAKAKKGEYCAEYALKNYSWKKGLEKVIEIYKE